MTYSYKWSHTYVSSVKIYILGTLEETTAIVNAEVVIFGVKNCEFTKFPTHTPRPSPSPGHTKLEGGGTGFGSFHTANAPKS